MAEHLLTVPKWTVGTVGGGGLQTTLDVDVSYDEFGLCKILLMRKQGESFMATSIAGTSYHRGKGYSTSERSLLLPDLAH